MQYTTTINDEAADFGMTAARLDYNASLPPQVLCHGVDAEGQPTEWFEPNPALMATNAAYLDFVLGNVVASWCQQFARGREVPPVRVGPAEAGG